MSIGFNTWLARLLTHGESVQADAPAPSANELTSSLAILRSAYDLHALSVAGPLIPFAEESGMGAAVWLAEACWMLVGEDTVAKLPTLILPTSPSDHLSADLTLRFLPSLYRRAMVRADRAVLAVALVAELCRWPLSGVLADFEGEPTGDTTFGGHAGLQMLYAERLLKVARPGWVPHDGSAREWAEWVFSERGRPLPTLLAPTEQTFG